MAISAMQAMPIIGGARDAQAVLTGIPECPQPLPVDRVEMDIEPVLKEMSDTRLANVWAFHVKGEQYARVPGPVVVVTEGTQIQFKIKNTNSIAHGFQIQGVTDTTVIQPGETRDITFEAPAGGTYTYLDPLNAPVNRSMGLFGALVSLPAENNGTPYSQPTQAIQMLFDDFGSAAHFPGDAWDRRRSWVWAFHSIDPAMHLLAQEAAFNGTNLNPNVFVSNYTSRYHEINGKNGFFSCIDPNTSPWGNCGMPALIRVINGGMTIFSPHIHGNHFYRLYDKYDGGIRDNVEWVDVITLKPLDVKDMCLPFIVPPDINVWPPSFQTNNRGTFSQFPLIYPMHCHTEMSQTASGGNYPWGALLHWTILTAGMGAAELTLGRPENPQVRFETEVDMFAS